MSSGAVSIKGNSIVFTSSNTEIFRTTPSSLLVGTTQSILNYSFQTSSLYTSSNVYVGKSLGIGSANGYGSLDILTPALTNTRESCLRLRCSDDITSAFYLYNTTISNNLFCPGFAGYTSSVDNRSLLIAGIVPTAGDLLTKTDAIIRITAYKTDGDPLNGNFSGIANTRLLDIQNYETSCLSVSANGNVGINTTTPSQKLSVNGNVSSYSVLYSTTQSVFIVGVTTPTAARVGSIFWDNSRAAMYIATGTANCFSYGKINIIAP
jgi:hypothetical protein